jgi:hypothetical protein
MHPSNRDAECLQGLPDDDEARVDECTRRYNETSSAVERALLIREAKDAYERLHPETVETDKAEEGEYEEYQEKIDFVVDQVLDQTVQNDGRSLGEFLFDMYQVAIEEHLVPHIMLQLVFDENIGEWRPSLNLLQSATFCARWQRRSRSGIGR